MLACPRKHAVALDTCLGLGCQPVEATLAMAAWPWLRALALVACQWGMPWLLHAPTLEACLLGATLVLVTSRVLGNGLSC